ncbi:hypothetical protein MferCBS49748_004085 [Microsporum ferrugineum]
MVDLGRPTADVPSRGYQLWLTDVVVVIVAGVFVVIRLVSRYLRSGIQVDDWTILAALLLSVLFSTAQNIAVEHGYVDSGRSSAVQAGDLSGQGVDSPAIPEDLLRAPVLQTDLYLSHRVHHMLWDSLHPADDLAVLACSRLLGQKHPAYLSEQLPELAVLCDNQHHDGRDTADSPGPADPPSPADQARQDRPDTGLSAGIIRLHNQHLPGDSARIIFLDKGRILVDDSDLQLERGGDQLRHHLRLPADGPPDALTRPHMLSAPTDDEERHLRLPFPGIPLGPLLSHLTGREAGIWPPHQPRRPSVGEHSARPRQHRADIDPIRQTPAAPSLGQ